MKAHLGRVSGFLGALAFALMTGVASAGPINLAQWYTFGFAGVGGDPLISGAGFVLGDRSIAAPDPAWTFDCPIYKCHLIVTDGFLAVDQFELFDFGVSLGQTSAPSGDASHSCGTDELGCLADAQMSHGVFILGIGAHSITGLHILDRPGAGFFIVRVPEPGTLLLMGLGLLTLVAVRRRA